MKLNPLLLLYGTIILMFPVAMLAQESYEMLIIQQEYDSILAKSSDLADTTGIYFHAYALDKTGRIPEAIEVMEEGIREFGSVTSIEIALAGLYYKTGQYASAKPILYKYMDQNDVFMKLIRVLEFESDHQQAIALLESRLETDSLNLDYLIRLGDNYEAADRILSARDTYFKIVELNNRDIVSMSKLANIYLKTKVYDGTIDLCRTALEMDSMNRTVFKLMGLAAFRKGDFDLSVYCFSKLLELGDTSFVNLKHLGISESRMYLFEKSVEHLLHAYEMDTADYEICYFLGRGFHNTEQPETGLRFLEFADTLIRPSPAFLAAIVTEKAAAYYSMKDYKKALHCYEEAYAYKPSPDYLFFMGSLYRYQFKNPRKALELYEKFLVELESNKGKSSTSNFRPGISMRNTAEQGILELKEELFFEGVFEGDIDE